MIIQSDSVLAKLRGKARRNVRDASLHLLCPSCRVRTKLYILKDGRRKCGRCGKKFYASKQTDEARLKQYADILLCFTLDFPAQMASTLTGYRYRLVASVYDHIRHTLAEQNLVPGKIRLLLTIERSNRDIHDSAFCKQCRRRFRCKGRKSGDAPIFGVKLIDGNQAFIEPLRDDEAAFRFDMCEADERMNLPGRFSGYAGFICRGKFHRFAENEQKRDGAEQLWAWMQQRLQRHHGIWKNHTGLYLKELEWKYNHRLLTPETQALKITELIPSDFLSAWPARAGRAPATAGEPVQNRAEISRR